MLLNTIRRNPPKPAPSSVRGTLKLRAREAGEPDQADRTSAPVADAPERSKADVQRARPTEAPRGSRPEGGRPARGEASRPDRKEATRPARGEAPRAAGGKATDGPRGKGRDATRGKVQDVVRAVPPGSSRSKAAETAPSAAPGLVSAEDRVPPEGVRLSKVMAERGICSRREADEFIERGWVFVDGKRVSELGVRIDPDARITLAAEATRTQQQRVTILLHKPVGYVSGQPEPGYAPAVSLIGADNQADRDSAQRFHPSHLKNLAPAGRLDIDSTGLLVLTQDGRVARQLIGEDSKIDKEYLVRVEGTLAENGLALLNHGLWLDDRPLRPAQVEWINDDQLRFVLREGRKRQIRRMCELVGLKVVGLKRVRIGRVKLGDLPLGQWRFLREDERFG